MLEQPKHFQDRLEEAVQAIVAVYDTHAATFSTACIEDGNLEDHHLKLDRDYAMKNFKGDDLSITLAAIDALKSLDDSEQRLWAIVAAEERFFKEPPGSRYWILYRDRYVPLNDTTTTVAGRQ